MFRSTVNAEVAISGLKLKVPLPPSGFAAALQINSTPRVLRHSDDDCPTKSTILRSVSGERVNHIRIDRYNKVTFGGLPLALRGFDVAHVIPA